ncbi:MAG: AAA family ATPase [Spirochaetia bacterium]|jgi:recombinational DNA repair ATPase RecF
MPISEIKVSAFRGIRKEVPISLEGRSLLLHGDNGTGKSSIERALRWALLGSEPPTDAEAFSSEESFRRHVLEPIENTRVKITLQNGGTIEVTAKESTSNSGGKEFQDSCVVGNPFLRRSEILSFLRSRPVDRFSYLETFLDISQVDDFKDAYSRVVEKCQSEMSTLSTRIETSLEILSAKLPEALRKQIRTLPALEEACFSHAISLSLVDRAVPYDWSLLVSSKARARELSEGNQLENERADLSSLQTQIAQFISSHIESALPDIPGLNGFVEDLKSSMMDARIVDLLTHAQRHLLESTTSICPVCGNTVNRESLLADLARRLSDLRSFREAKANLDVALSSWKKAALEFEVLSRHIISSLRPSEVGALRQPLGKPKGFELLEGVEDKTTNEQLLAIILSIGTVEIQGCMRSVAEEARIKTSETLSKLPPTSASGELAVFANVVEELERKRASLTQDEERHSILEKRRALATIIAEALRHARQDVAKEILDSISETVVEFYKYIHPNADTSEATGAPSIKVQRHGKGTAFVQGVFAGQPVPDPNWVYSDGHLDTVGICVFLALRRFRADRKGDAKLMVLDDVVLSIDLAHARRFIGLLKDRFSDHQILIFTHNGLFAHWCARMLPGMKKLSISSWSLQAGPRIGEYRTAIRNVELSIPDQSPKQIAMEVMALMDEWLSECRYAFSLAVPAKYGEQYTMADIWDVFAKTIKKIAKTIGSDLGGAARLVDQVNDLPSVRNALAGHENEFAREFPKQTIVEIAQNTVALVRSLYCEGCQSFCQALPNRFEPIILRCDCGNIQHVKTKSAEQ